MLVVQSVSKSFQRNEVLSGVNFDLEEGIISGLVGPSGGGKSVLLKILGGVIEPDQGEVSFAHQTAQRSDFRVGFLFQEGALFDSFSILENVAFPLLVSDRTGGKIEKDKGAAYETSAEMLERVGLAKHLTKFPGQLSGGMRRRVAIARALASRPDLALLDDPTGGLDPVASSKIIALIQDLQQQLSTTVLMVSHDIRRLLPNVERVLALFDGKIVCNEHPRDLLDNAEPRVIEFLSRRYDFEQDGISE